MAGGTGSRLWPLSRELMPKQFLQLTNEQTMLQDTVERLSGLEIYDPVVICNEEHRFIAAEQLRSINCLDNNIILEPVGRNTAPAVCLAAIYAEAQKSDPILLVLAADHAIVDAAEFRKKIAIATKLAESGKLVTFGIVPNSPETGYGYIRKGEQIQGGDAFEVSEFVEKPDLQTATNYLNSGDYAWNSGMFMFRASKFLEEINKYRPDIFNVCVESLAKLDKDLDFVRVIESVFRTCPSESIDYAVMEKTEDAVVMPIDIGWNDVGSWSALWDIGDKDSDGNVHKTEVMSVNSEGNYVYSENGIVGTVGLKDTVIVQTKDALLVAAKDSVQEVKTIVGKLKADNREEYKLHREVYRPWGKYDSIDNGERYQVKRITVHPGEKLSVQMHHHRAEHWIVVAGTAKVTINEAEQLLTENQSVYIPVGAVHALENPGKIPLELIEVQSGTYLGEDDIVRFSDRYGRT
ncbi:MAG: mannose-1-phosphate guanylyltransferase/mannose-6-phosphate isomerase [Alteromonadaceae bacterium]|nr:mannose-1-phosphate guanylyltransferase/mannose-6-phosphate isomerase [Alteromonadaceae bacterium]